MKSKKLKTLIRYVFYPVFTLIVFYVLLSSYGIRAYTFGWHSIYENPIHWGNILITVPKSFIASHSKKKYSSLLVESINHKNVPSISFFQFDENLLITEETIKEFDKNIEVILEKIKCTFLTERCFWSRGLDISSNVNNRTTIDYTEHIVLNFDSRTILISFYGHIYERKFFLEIIKNLKKASFDSSEWKVNYPINQPERFLSIISSQNSWSKQ